MSEGSRNSTMPGHSFRCVTQHTIIRLIYEFLHGSQTAGWTDGAFLPKTPNDINLSYISSVSLTIAYRFGP